MKKKVILVLPIIILISIIFYFFFVKIDNKYDISFNQYKIEEKDYNILKINNLKKIKKYNYKIYKDNELLKDINTIDNNINIIDNRISINDKITVKITIYNNFINKKLPDYTITWKENKLKLPDIESNYKGGNISGRKYLKLTSLIDDTSIYYTTDGSIPDKSSNLYKEPIKLDKDMIINAVSMKENYLNSDYKVLQFKIKSTKPVIYLSPSLQDENSGVPNTGYSTEEAMMNKIADVVEPILKKEGYTVYRNNISMTLTKCVNDSKSKDVDLHLALHSNASSSGMSGRYTGIETWKYNDKNIIVNDIASLLQKNIMKVYYNKNKNRGVKNSIDIGGLRETNPAKVDNGILIEIGFHDNYSDATWISSNIKNIGTNIAGSVIEYFTNNKF